MLHCLNFYSFALYEKVADTKKFSIKNIFSISSEVFSNQFDFASQKMNKWITGSLKLWLVDVNSIAILFTLQKIDLSYKQYTVGGG